MSPDAEPGQLDVGMDIGDRRQSTFPEDALSHLLPMLSTLELRLFASGSQDLMRALQSHGDEHKRAKGWVPWLHMGGNARLLERDASLASCDNSWHPGGAAVAKLFVSESSSMSFRFVLETNAKRGDLIFGITKSFGNAEDQDLAEALETGYCFIMGRDLAPASIFYGGRSLRCCFSNGFGEGPRIDYGPSSGVQVEGRLSRLSNVGDWVRFDVLKGGQVEAHDMAGRSMRWGFRIQEGDLWQPTVAWTGSNAVIRIERAF
mmetsp:Transcript_106144/g.236889  ORF Transcript_106144/g.236889 Transcript_106144/m.236889 type:complete len:261 (-) Transcript_106144:16-798(-)